VQQPAVLGAREVRVEREPSALAKQRLVTRRAQLVAQARPCAGSQATTVSRWFVMPMPFSSGEPASSIACFATRSVTSQISFASCSTQPGFGKCCSNSL
jgi:hypothetical protein